MSRSARFSIRERSGVSLLLFQAVYTSFQNPVTSVILEGSVHSHTVLWCFFSTLEIASFPLFLPFLTCLISDLPSKFLQRTRQTTKSEN